jgi:hypothetical protein
LEVPVDFIGTGTGAGMLQGRIEGSEMGAANGNWRTWRTLVYNVLEAKRWHRHEIDEMKGARVLHGVNSSDAADDFGHHQSVC